MGDQEYGKDESIEDFYRSLFETAGDAIFILDVSTDKGATFLYCNQRTLRLFGCTRLDEIVGKGPQDFSPDLQPDGQPSEKKIRDINEAMAKGVSQRFEWEHKQLDGSPFYVDVVLSRIGAGNRSRVLAVVRDITSRKRAEEELADREDRLSTIIAASKDAMVAIDSKGLIQIFNPAAEEMFARRNEEMVGRPLDDLMPQEYRANHTRDIASYFATGKPDGVMGKTIEVPAVRANGEQFPIEVSLAVGGEGEHRFVLGVIRDITERRILEAQLQQAQRLDSLGQLAGGVAHDFNNMLGGIMGAADLLALRTTEDSRSQRLVNLVIDTAERARDLTDKLLAFSRKGRVVTQPVDVHKAIGDAVEILARSIDRRISIITKLEAKDAVVQGDLTQIQNTILNLGINARDAMPNGGVLRLTTGNVDLDDEHCSASPFDLKTGRYIRISVDDDGHGMAPEVQSRIFDPFFTTKDVGEGTGLGLSAAYGTVREHHGSIAVRSEPRKGTCFEICFPILEGAPIPAPKKKKGFTAGSGCVLVVEDEKVVRAMAELLLEELGYEVLIAEDGFAGVEMFRRNQDKIDVVILDMLMPKMSGREVFRDIRSMDPQAKVLMSSGFARDAGVSELMEEGLAGFLKKPYHRDELAQALNEVLRADERET